MALSAEFIYLAALLARLARLARQWIKERGIIVCALSVGFIYLAARLARQWKNLYGVNCWVHIFSGSLGSFGSTVDKRTDGEYN